MFDFSGKKVMVVGMAASGISAARLLLKLGAEVTLYDAKPVLPDKLKGLQGKCRCIFEQDPSADVEEMDALVLSPGVPTRLEFIQKAYAFGKYVIAEIELGFQTSRAGFVCISGTNGKTTTTALTGEIFKNAGINTYVLGNIGVPICEKSAETKNGDIVVAETAALQLETVDTFKPRAAALLNITEDHMDRFLTMEYYTACKMKMFENQDSSDYAVFNYDDETVREQAKNIKSNAVFFSRKQKVTGAYVEAGRIVFEYCGKKNDICGADEVYIPGNHNLENALAAVCLASVMGISPKVIAYTLKTFKGVEHRIEFVKTVNDVDFINDSKGTNPDATIKAIQAMKKPTVLILGGFDKHSEFDTMFKAFTPMIKGAVILGQTRDKIRAAADANGFDNYELAETFEEAVKKAYKMAQKGGTVLLSPACASWGMFKNFEERGKVFKEIVANLR